MELISIRFSQGAEFSKVLGNCSFIVKNGYIETLILKLGKS